MSALWTGWNSEARHAARASSSGMQRETCLEHGAHAAGQCGMRHYSQSADAHLPPDRRDNRLASLDCASVCEPDGIDGVF